MLSSLLLLAITVGPYIQDVTPSGFVVVWETSTLSHGTLEVGKKRVMTSGLRHEARVDGLAAGTRYDYRVLVDGAPLASGETHTAPTGDGPLSFVVYGDTRDGLAREMRIAELIAAEAPELVLHTGDLVGTGDDLDEWRSFFAAEAPLLSSVPVYPAVGNHELYEDPAGANFKRFFVLPENGRERRWYRFRWGPAEFVALDGNDRFAEQAVWLREVLERGRARHVFVFVHQPPFSTGGHCGSAPLQKEWIDLFERYDVRAVFGGHDHAYERLERHGVTYFVTGGGGSEVYPERSDCPAYDFSARKRYAAAHHYLRVRVRGDEVQVTAQLLDGGALETTTLRPRAERTLAAAGLAPPLVDDRWFPKLPRKYALYAGAGLLLFASLMLRRRKISR